jgi:hypothetical protein
VLHRFFDTPAAAPPHLADVPADYQGAAKSQDPRAKQRRAS